MKNPVNYREIALFLVPYCQQTYAQANNKAKSLGLARASTMPASLVVHTGGLESENLFIAAEEEASLRMCKCPFESESVFNQVRSRALEYVGKMVVELEKAGQLKEASDREISEATSKLIKDTDDELKAEAAKEVIAAYNKEMESFRIYNFS